MNASFLVMTAGVAVFLFFTIFSNHLRREHLNSMAGMTIAMSISTLFGLLFGIVLGAFLKDELFFSTIISMGAALLVGYFVAFPFGLFAVLEGIIASIMGGMMGTMLASMVSGSQVDALIKIVFTLYIVTTVIILGYVWDHKLVKYTYMKSPFFVANILFLFFFFFHQLGPVIKEDGTFFLNKHQHYSSQHKNVTVLNVTAREFHYIFKQTVVKKGETVVIKLTNKGQVEHDLEFINIEGIKVESVEKHQHSKPDTVHLHAAPGAKNTLFLTFEKTGKYRFFCTLPKHKELGMIGEIDVQS